jgi:hypothetical protein
MGDPGTGGIGGTGGGLHDGGVGGTLGCDQVPALGGEFGGPNDPIREYLPGENESFEITEFPGNYCTAALTVSPTECTLEDALACDDICGVCTPAFLDATSIPAPETASAHLSASVCRFARRAARWARARPPATRARTSATRRGAAMRTLASGAGFPMIRARARSGLDARCLIAPPQGYLSTCAGTPGRVSPCKGGSHCAWPGAPPPRTASQAPHAPISTAFPRP